MLAANVVGFPERDTVAVFVPGLNVVEDERVDATPDRAAVIVLVPGLNVALPERVEAGLDRATVAVLVPGVKATDELRVDEPPVRIVAVVKTLLEAVVGLIAYPAITHVANAPTLV